MAVIALPISLLAQASAPPASRVAFDAASLKRNTSGGTSMQVRTPLLSGQAGRVVVDETGLDGYYAFTLSYAQQPAAAADNAPGDRPSLFTALSEQLGLKLEAQRSPVETLVIDRIERPTED